MFNKIMRQKMKNNKKIINKNLLCAILFFSSVIVGGETLAGAAVAEKLAAKPYNPEYSPESNQLENRPWSVLLYAGATAYQTLGPLVLQGEFTSAKERVYSAELAYNLSQENPIRKFFKSVVGTIQVAANIGYRDDLKPNFSGITETDVYVMARWLHFPWNNYVTTTLAAGEGISYTSHVPRVEIEDIDATGSRRLLNYLVGEVTFALPSHPAWQLVVRLHHRSTAYGVFGDTNGGSNTIGLGIRYAF
jgi:hypothetical protein